MEEAHWPQILTEKIASFVELCPDSTSVCIQLCASWRLDAVEEFVNAVHFPKPLLPEAGYLLLQF